MGTLTSLPKQGIVAPLKLPPAIPSFYTDFAHDSDLEWWTVESGTWSIIDGELDVVQVVADSVIRANVPNWYNLRAAFEVLVIVWGAEGPVLITRYIDAVNHYWIQLHGPINGFRIIRRVGADVVLNQVAFVLAANVWYRVSERLGDGDIYCTADGTVCAAVDGAPIAAGGIALKIYNCHARFDDFYVRTG